MTNAKLVEAVARAIATDAGHTTWDELPADDVAAHYSGVRGGTWYCKADYHSHARAALAAIEAEGFAVVPVEPNEAMVEAGRAATAAYLNLEGSGLTVAREKMRRRYAAMLAAAPKVTP